MKTKTTIIVAVIAFLFITGYLFIPSATGNASKNQNEEIKIGAILMLTGDNSYYGENSLKGINLAPKELNRSDIILEVQDNGNNDPKQALSTYSFLTQKGYNIIIGPNFVTSALAVAPQACQDKSLLIPPTAGAPEIYTSCDTVFDIWPIDDTLSIKLSNHLMENQLDNIAIVGSQDSWDQHQSEVIHETYTNIGGVVSYYELTPTSQTDFKTELLKVKESGANGVVITNYAHTDIIAKQAKELNIDLPLYPLLTDEDKVRDANGALEGTIFFNTFTPTREFTEAFKREYGEEPGMGSANSYDAVMIIVEAVDNTGSTDPEVISEYILQKSEFKGASGTLKLNTQGGAIKDPLMMKILNGKIIPLD